METSAVQRMDLNTIVDKAGTIAKMVMVEATKLGGLHFASSARAIGASVKYIGISRDTYRGNPVVEGIIDRINHWRGETDGNFDYKTLDSADVMKSVDAITPALDSQGEQGVQAKRFIYGLAEAMVNASGSGFMGTGERVNEDEARFLADLKLHLRL